MFLLKNKYNWKDKIEVDSNINGKLAIDSTITVDTMSLIDRANYIKRNLLE